MVIQALMLAWCDTCPNDDLDSILSWAQSWRSVLKQGDICWLHDPEDEFYCRSKDVQGRYELMLSALRKNASWQDHPDETMREIGMTSASHLLMHLLRDVAIQNPAAVPFHTTPEQYRPWMDDTLSSGPFRDVSEAGRELLKVRRERGTDEYLSRSLWIWLHGKNS